LPEQAECEQISCTVDYANILCCKTSDSFVNARPEIIQALKKYYKTPTRNNLCSLGPTVLSILLFICTEHPVRLNFKLMSLFGDPSESEPTDPEQSKPVPTELGLTEPGLSEPGQSKT